MIFKIFVLGALLFGLGYSQQRPIDQWAQRGVMPGKGRILFLALSNNVTLAYETKNCGLYMAWDGGMQDGNATYNHQTAGNHGATIYARGQIMHKQSNENSVSPTPVPENRPKTHTTPNTPPVTIWTLLNGNASVNISLDYRGHSVNPTANTATLHYQIESGTNVIEVSETPNASGNSTVVNRVFQVSGLPQGQSLRLKLDGAPITGNVEDWTADGIGSVSTSGGIDYLTLSSNGTSTVVGTWR